MMPPPVTNQGEGLLNGGLSAAAPKPVPTLYLKNLREKIKSEGKFYNHLIIHSRDENISLPFALYLWRSP